jgi:hypothetical protein
MLVAYLSSDEVNQALAAEMALECGLSAQLVAPKDTLEGEYDALLCDWDSWPAEGRRQLLAGLDGHAPCRRVAVHGYGLTEEQAETLLGRGVAVHRRLGPEVFRLLRQAARLSRPPAADWRPEAKTA